MNREQLVNFRGLMLSWDTTRAIEQLVQKLENAKWKIKLLGPQASTPWSANSLIPAGREIHFQVQHTQADAQACLEALWGYAIPLGFTPKTRYPLADQSDSHIFYFFGPWQLLHDSLLAEGRGQLAWPSLCVAAQCDVGAWKGDKEEIRFLQAQLHRLGYPCGSVDGIIGERVLHSLKAAGVHGLPLQQAIEQVRNRRLPSAPVNARQAGHLALPGRKLVIYAYGGVKATQTAMGVSLVVDSPGQLVVEVGDVSN